MLAIGSTPEVLLWPRQYLLAPLSNLRLTCEAHRILQRPLVVLEPSPATVADYPG